MLASAIEKRTGAAPHAELGRFGRTLAERFAGRPGGSKTSLLPPGFLGAIGAAQIRRGTDPDTVVLTDGPTRDALRGKGQGNEGSRFAPLPKLKQSVGPPLSNRAPNRPEDARALQGKLASLGYAPRVTEKPLFPHDAGKQPLTPPFYPPRGRAGRQVSSDLQALLDGVRLFQRREGLRPDALVNPGGPTERALDTRNERARGPARPPEHGESRNHGQRRAVASTLEGAKEPPCNRNAKIWSISGRTAGVKKPCQILSGQSVKPAAIRRQ